MDALKESIIYAAGYFDGEGTIGMGRVGIYYHLRIAAMSGDYESLTVLASCLGGSLRFSYKTKETNRPIYRWLLCGSKAVECLKVLEPYLRAKRSQALLVLNSAYKSQDGRSTRSVSEEQKAVRIALRKALQEEKKPTEENPSPIPV